VLGAGCARSGACCSQGFAAQYWLSTALRSTGSAGVGKRAGADHQRVAPRVSEFHFIVQIPSRNSDVVSIGRATVASLRKISRQRDLSPIYDARGRHLFVEPRQALRHLDARPMARDEFAACMRQRGTQPWFREYVDDGR